ncbi:MAG: discoidin domain-containing protein [Nocardioidaceae bacterium]
MRSIPLLNRCLLAAALVTSALPTPAASGAVDRAAGAAGAVGGAGVVAAQAKCARGPSSDGWQLATTSPAKAAAAPAYAGNGYLGTRVPAAGHGFVGSPVAAETHIAGVWSDVPDVEHGGTFEQGGLNLPGWTRLDLTTGGESYFSDGKVTCYRQSLDLRRGVISTSSLWQADSGRRTTLRYDVAMDRARHRVGLVRLTFTPHWSGRVGIVDRLGDGFAYTPGLSPVRTSASAHQRTADLAARTHGTSQRIAYADRLLVPERARVRAATSERSTTLQAGFGVRRGNSYTVAKVVGFATSVDSDRPIDTAARAARAAAHVGPRKLVAENAEAWRALWRSDIRVPGNTVLQRRIRAAEFYLLSSVRPNVDWSISPVGLSSFGFNNHVFWDTETWMYPALLAQHPRDASTVVDYRYRTRDGARRNARRTGVRRHAIRLGERPHRRLGDPDMGRNQGTGTTHHLRRGTWAVAVLPGHRPTALAARTRLADPARRRPLLGQPGRAQRRRLLLHQQHRGSRRAQLAGRRLRLHQRRCGHHAAARHPRCRRGRRIIPRQLGQDRGRPADLAPEVDGRVPRRTTRVRRVRRGDCKAGRCRSAHVPVGAPAAPPRRQVHAGVLRAALRHRRPGHDRLGQFSGGLPARAGGLLGWTYTQRSLLPFVRGPYEQFTEARGGQGVFTFHTGEGGFLQEFLNGYTGLRWWANHIRLAPSLPPQLRDGLTLTELHWQGRTFTVDIGAQRTRVQLTSGKPMTVATPKGNKTVSIGFPITLPTRRPDQRPTRDVARCQPATATASDISHQPGAAVDGSAVTSWSLPADNAAHQSLTIDLGPSQTVRAAEFHWLVTPHTGYRLQVDDGDGWHTVLRVGDGAGADVRRELAPTEATRVRLLLPRTRIGSGSPMLGEMKVLR